MLTVFCCRLDSRHYGHRFWGLLLTCLYKAKCFGRTLTITSPSRSIPSHLNRWNPFSHRAWLGILQGSGAKATCLVNSAMGVFKLEHSNLAQHQAGIVQQLRQLWMEDHLCDVVLKSHDGAEHRAHTALLSAASVVFRKLLSGSFIEAEQVKSNQPIEIPASTTALAVLLDFIYGGQPEVPVEAGLELLRLAEAYDLPKFAAAIEMGLLASLDSANALQVLQEAHGLHGLKDACEEKVAEDFEACSQHPEFGKLSAGQLARILKRGDLKVSREEAVLKSIFNWLNISRDEHAFSMLLQHVDFQSFSFENLLRLSRCTLSGPNCEELQREVSEALSLHRKRAQNLQSSQVGLNKVLYVSMHCIFSLSKLRSFQRLTIAYLLKNLCMNWSCHPASARGLSSEEELFQTLVARLGGQYWLWARSFEDWMPFSLLAPRCHLCFRLPEKKNPLLEAWWAGNSRTRGGSGLAHHWNQWFGDVLSLVCLALRRDVRPGSWQQKASSVSRWTWPCGAWRPFCKSHGLLAQRSGLLAGRSAAESGSEVGRLDSPDGDCLWESCRRSAVLRGIQDFCYQGGGDLFCWWIER